MIQEVKMYTIICDNCGKNVNEGNEITCWSDKGYAEDSAMESDWIKEDGNHYCADCFEYDDEDNLVIKGGNNEKQKTAMQQLVDYYQDVVEKRGNELTAMQVLNLVIRKASELKEMEKEQHERFNKFLNDEIEFGISDKKTVERIQWYYNTYFNKTYGGN